MNLLFLVVTFSSCPHRQRVGLQSSPLVSGGLPEKQTYMWVSLCVQMYWGLQYQFKCLGPDVYAPVHYPSSSNTRRDFSELNCAKQVLKSALGITFCVSLFYRDFWKPFEVVLCWSFCTCRAQITLCSSCKVVNMKIRSTECRNTHPISSNRTS